MAKKEYKISLLSHYRKLWFFLLHRKEKGNYPKMRYYLATILLAEVAPYINLKKKKVLDIGGSNGEFCKFLNDELKCAATNLDPYAPKKLVWKKTVKAPAHKMPFKDNSFDFEICRGVLEHIPRKHRKKTLSESYRVMKKGGIGYFVIPPWYNPHAGHMLKPFHVLPFPIAQKLRKILFGNYVKGNSYEEVTLHPITFREAKNLFIEAGFTIESTLDTHLRLHFLTRIPILREFMVPAVAFILKK